MQRYLKKGISLLICFSFVFALAACSRAAAITEDNITKTVALVEKALKELDGETLKKYINSKTLNYIINYSERYEQISELGKAMFENLTLEVKSIDTENKTVTLLVNNKDMSLIAERYVSLLNHTFDSTLDMLTGLGDEDFLNTSLKSLKAQIARAIVPDNPTEITVSVSSDKKNLVFNFDETAEDAISGGALSTIKNAFTQKVTAAQSN